MFTSEHRKDWHEMEGDIRWWSKFIYRFNNMNNADKK